LHLNAATIIITFKDAPYKATFGTADGTRQILATYEDGTPVADANILFSISGVAGDPIALTTNESGIAEFTIPGDLKPGDYVLTAQHESASATAVLTVVKADSQVDVKVSDDANDPAIIGDTAHIKTTVTSTDGVAIAGVTVDIQRNGQSLGQVTTGDDGVAEKEIPLTEDMGVGTLTFKAIFAGNDCYNGSEGEGNIDVAAAPTTITMDTTPVSVQAGGKASLSATLTRSSDGAPLAHRPIRWTRNDGETVATGETDDSGTATAELYADWALGSYQIKAVFDGNDLYEASESDEKTVQVTRPDLRIEVRDEKGRRGDVIPLRGWVYRATDGKPLENVLVEWWVEREYIRSDRTNPSGYSAIGLPTAGRQPGGRTYYARVKATADYNAGEGQGKLIILP
jgi:hypothetical protein